MLLLLLLLLLCTKLGCFCRLLKRIRLVEHLLQRIWRLTLPWLLSSPLLQKEVGMLVLAVATVQVGREPLTPSQRQPL